MNLCTKILLGLSSIVITQCIMLAASYANPPGSYQRSCWNIQAIGNTNGDITLYATCSNGNGEAVNSQLRHYDTCKEDISNIDGYLTCARGNFAPPPGSYRETCRDLYVKELTPIRFRLSAICQSIDGGWHPTAIEYTHDYRNRQVWSWTCETDLSNINGVLQEIAREGVVCVQ
ncbi:CVNH domain-containing protein [Nostoc sp. C117]|uniref:CVNH domain-containing protein n=1 Tax=Nostoc sp. C117 TaxID=3349875 RepID=UPI00370DC863